VSIIHCVARMLVKLSQLKTAIFYPHIGSANLPGEAGRSVERGDAIGFREVACGGVRRLNRPAQWELRLPLAH
jgi:hypothetical protein